MEKDQSNGYEQLVDDSRRSFMKKGALASGALALGLGSGTAAGEANLQQQPSQTLMFGYDYQPSRTLQHVSRLQQSVTRTILGQQIGDDGQAVVSDTSEWTTHLAYYQTQGDVPGEYVLLFTRSGQVSQGDQLSLGSSATFFSDEINMLEVTLGGGGGGDGGGG